MVEITIEKLISLTGELKDNSPSSEKFRSFISSPDVSRSDLNAWINECLEKAGQSFNQALQDMVNCIGERLGFKVDYGRYERSKDLIEYDGKWVSEEANVQLVVETEKTEAYRINPDQFGGYTEELRKKASINTEELRKIKVPEMYKRIRRAYGLFVIGEEEPTTLISTIRGSRYRDTIRVIPVKSLLNLFRMKEEIPLSHAQIVKLLLPIDAINVGEVIETIEDIIETRLKEEKIETPTKARVHEGKKEEDLPTD